MRKPQHQANPLERILFANKFFFTLINYFQLNSILNFNQFITINAKKFQSFTDDSKNIFRFKKKVIKLTKFISMRHKETIWVNE